MAFILYLDRICMGQAAPDIRRELGLSLTQMTFVHMAFTLAYGLFEVPTGRWGDRFGSRRVLARIVLWWSGFTALTGLVPYFSFDSGYVVPAPWGYIPLVFDSLILLILIRFLFGAGEAGAYPNAARVLTCWFPERERGNVQGIMLTFAQVGGAIAPMVAAWLIDLSTWRWTFIVFGCVGAIWVPFFYFWFRDLPAQHPGVNQAELQWIGPPRQMPHHDPLPWRTILAHPSVWLLGGIMTLASFVFYMLFSWYPTYLQEARNVSQQESGNLMSMVLAVGAVGTLAGGFVANWVNNRSGDRLRIRRAICFGCYAVAAAFLAASIVVDSPLLSAMCAAASCMAMFSYQGHWWASAIELSGKHLGALFGLLNGVGVLGAMTSQFLFGYLADLRAEWGYTGREQWDPLFYIYVAALLMTAVFWLGVDTSRPVAGEVEHKNDEIRSTNDEGMNE
jgi:sugar phosphate permease